MITYIGLGSNVGNRLQNLEQATKEMEKAGLTILKVSPVYENPALLPPKAPAEWNHLFLNAIAQIQCDKKTPEQLLSSLKTIEKKLGRRKNPKWAPRIIDLDILLFDNKVINTPQLKTPHPELRNRNFVITPLKEMQPSLKVPLLELKVSSKTTSPLKKKMNTTILSFFRHSRLKLPTWMHIVNTTPDSFSDGGQINLNNFESVLKQVSDQHIHIVDLGAESTRPEATPVSPTEEWQRLVPYMEKFHHFYGNKTFRPKLSVDTRYPQTAKKALEKKADIINDVSGLTKEMLQLLKCCKAEYVLTHSVTVPADRKKTLPLNKDPVEEIKNWLDKKINILENNNISLDRVIFDPGIGFGKTASQSLEILRRINEFHSFPLRIMVGHSRKSFMKTFTTDAPEKRDPESAGLSLSLTEKGVDILRVHRADFHARIAKGFLS